MDPARIVPDDQVWLAIKSECALAAEREPLLAGFLYATVLSQPDIEESLSYLLASKLDNSTLPALGVRDIILQVLNEDECIQRAILADLQAVDARIDARVFDVLSVEASVSSRTSLGGTAPGRVKVAAEAAIREIPQWN